MSGQRRGRNSSPAEPEGQTGATEDERSRQAFYEHLRQRGELIDVGHEADLSQLPPGVTHVRYPNGRIERVGFA